MAPCGEMILAAPESAVFRVCGIARQRTFAPGWNCSPANSEKELKKGMLHDQNKKKRPKNRLKLNRRKKNTLRN
jgi:hypothetical protein